MFGPDPNQILASGYGGAEPGINQATQRSVGYLSPYQKTGTDALSAYYKELQARADPQAYYSKIMSGYQMSPGAKFQEQQGLESLKNQAASLGLTGSGEETKDILRYSQRLASQDQQGYLQNILGIGQGYLGGKKGLTGTGLQAGAGMGREEMGGAEDIAKLKMAQEQAEAQEAAQQKKALSSILGTTFGSVAEVLPYL